MKNLKIRVKLFVGFGIVLLLLIILGLSAISNIGKLSRVAEDYKDKYLPSTKAIWQIRRNMVSVQRYLLLALVSTDLDKVNEALQNFDNDRSDIDVAVDNLLKSYPDSNTKIMEFENLLSQAKPYREQIKQLSIENTDESNAHALTLFTENYVPAFDKAAQCLLDLTDSIDKNTAQQDRDAESTANLAFLLNVIILAGAILITLVVIVIITNSLVKPIKEIQKAAESISEGILQTEIKYSSHDELGSLADSMRKTEQTLKIYISEIEYAIGEFAKGNFDIREPKQPFIGEFSSIETSIRKSVAEMSDTMLQVSLVSDQVSSGASQVSSGAQSLAQGTTEQASAVQELSSSITEITAQVRQNAESSKQANIMAESATNAIINSNEQMQKLMDSMNGIHAKSAEISKIIKAIEDISFQTNILALNAAVEAARAGAAGKGFAVVADEVRNLANKSAEAAKNTTALIEDSVESINDGVNLADVTANELLGVVDSVKSTTEIISEITRATGEQSIALEQVSTGIEQISMVVQANSGTSEESAAASEELNSQADVLRGLISKFKIKRTNSMHRNDFAMPKRTKPTNIIPRAKLSAEEEELLPLATIADFDKY